MNELRSTSGTISDAHVDEIVGVLNASHSGLASLDDWAAWSDVEADRVIEGPDVTYVRLAGQAEHGGPVVLAHFERTWERATYGRRPASQLCT